MFGEYMKFIVALFLVISLQLFPDICVGEGSIENPEIGIGGYTARDLILNKDMVVNILKEAKGNHDHRQIYNEYSEEFLETYGKLKIDGAQKCTANLVSDRDTNDSVIVITAAHCFKPGDEDKSITVEFTKRNGASFSRRLSMETINNEYDYAILRLGRKIHNHDIIPLVLSEYDAEEMWEEIEMMDLADTMTLTFGGFNSDSTIGDGGRLLTYDQNCEIFGFDRGYEITTNCIGYPGASGGACVISYDDIDDERQNLFVGVNKSVSFDPYATETPWRANFVDLTIMYEDIERALTQ